MEKNRDFTKLIIQNYIQYMIIYAITYIYVCVYTDIDIGKEYISDKRNSGYKWGY